MRSPERTASMKLGFTIAASALAALALATAPAFAQAKKGSKPVPAAAAAPQKIDEEFTKLIKEYLQDPRVSTELVDHMPASRSEEHTSELQSLRHLVCRLLLAKK